MKFNKIILGFGILILLFSISLISVSAIGAGGVPTYIEVSPGQTVDRTLSLQNLPAGEGDLIFKIIVDKGSEYVSVIDEEVEVLDGQIDESRIKISIPNDANIGDVYNIKIDFKTSSVSLNVGSEEGTAVQFSRKIRATSTYWRIKLDMDYFRNCINCCSCYNN